MTAPAGVSKTDFNYRIDLLEKGRVLVQEDALVAPGDLLAKIESLTCHQVDLTEAVPLVLGEEGLNRLAINIGATVEKGTVLVAKSGHLIKKELLLPVGGRVVGYNEAGVLKIESGREERVTAPFGGRIRFPAEKVLEISFPAQVFTASWAWGRAFTGKVVQLEPAAETVFNVRAEVLGTIVLCRQPVSQAAFFKLESLGAGGVVIVGEVVEIKSLVEKLPAHFGQRLGLLVFSADQSAVTAELAKSAGRRAFLNAEKAELVVAAER